MVRAATRPSDSARDWIWQPAGFIGAQVAGDPGTVGWHELVTPDIEAAKEFYGAVFGWQTTALPGNSGNGDDGLAWRIAERLVGGLVEAAPPNRSADWSVWFAVPDAKLTVAKATALGGTFALPSAASSRQSTMVAIRMAPASRSSAPPTPATEGSDPPHHASVAD